MLLLTLESTPGYFIVHTALYNDSTKEFIATAEFRDIEKLSNLLKKYSIIVVYNFKKIDIALLGAALRGVSPRNIYELKSRFKKLGRDLYDDDEYKMYVRGIKSSISFIDLKYVNSLHETDILKVGINKFNIDVYPVLNIRSYTDEYKSNLIKSLQSKSRVLRLLFEYSFEELSIRKRLSYEYGYDLMSYGLSDLTDYVIMSEYCSLTKDTFRDIRSRISEYDYVNIAPLIPKLTFKNNNINDVIGKLKSYTVTKSNKINFKINLKEIPVNLKQGGLHSINKPNDYNNKTERLIYVDANTFYGNLIINNGIRPSHLNGKFIEVVQKLVDKREEYRNSDDLLDKIYKLIIASISGNLNYKKSLLRDYVASIQLYLVGQLTLLDIIDKLETYSNTAIIFVNTDGFIIKSSNMDISDILTKELDRHNLNWKIRELQRFVIRDINNYLYIDTIGLVETVGVFNQNTGSPIIGKSVFNYYVHNIPISQTVQESTSLTDFCLTETPEQPMRLWKVKGDKATLIPNTCRYFIAKHSKYNVCHSPKSGHVLTYLVKGKSVKIANSLSEHTIDEVNKFYYINKAQNIIDKTIIKQLNLWDF